MGVGNLTSFDIHYFLHLFIKARYDKVVYFRLSIPIDKINEKKKTQNDRYLSAIKKSLLHISIRTI